MSPTKTTNEVYTSSAMAKSILASVDRLAAKLRETNSTVDALTMKNTALSKECGSLKIRLRLAEGDHSKVVSNLQESLDSKSQQYEATKVLLYAADQTITKLRSEKRRDELQQLEEQQQHQLANQQGKEPLDQLDESLVAQHGEQLVDQPDELSVNQQGNPSASEQDQALVDHQIQLSVDQQHQPSVNEQDQLQGNQQGELFVNQRTQSPVDAQTDYKWISKVIGHHSTNKVSNRLISRINFWRINSVNYRSVDKTNHRSFSSANHLSLSRITQRSTAINNRQPTGRDQTEQQISRGSDSRSDVNESKPAKQENPAYVFGMQLTADEVTGRP